MVTCRAASSMMVRGTKLPANRTAAEMRGSTTASRVPMEITPPEPDRAADVAQRKQGVEGGLPFRDRPVHQREDEPDDLAGDRLACLQCPA